MEQGREHLGNSMIFTFVNLDVLVPVGNKNDKVFFEAMT
jgi:hypothetical protein